MMHVLLEGHFLKTVLELIVQLLIPILTAVLLDGALRVRNGTFLFRYEGEWLKTMIDDSNTG